MAAQGQAPVKPDLPDRVVTAVDRLSPGFTEILENDDTFALTRLTETLAASGSAEAVPVLAWIIGHRQAVNPESVAIRLNKAISSAKIVPVAALSRTLRNGSADQRRAAAIVLLESRDLVPDAERAALEATLISALSDPSVEVRTLVAMSLRRLGTPTAVAALAASVRQPNVTPEYYFQATGKRRPAEPVAPALFPAPVIASIDAIAPGFLGALQTQDDQAIWKLIGTLAPIHSEDTAQVLTWILINANVARHGERVARLLVENHQRTGVVPIREIADLLHSADPDRRFGAANFFDQLFSQRQPRVTVPEGAAVIDALIRALADPIVHVRRVAAQALGRARSREAIPALLESMQLEDASRYYLTTVFNTLAAIGDPRAVPALERWARSPREWELRAQAARIAINISKPADRAAAARRLLWEQPDTALEREVLARGNDALPRAWRTLADGGSAERRAALALLGWVRDVRSIPHILTALDSSPGAISRQQLLFDLNAILLTEAPELRETADIDLLTRQHLTRVLEDLAPAPSDTSRKPLCASTMILYPVGVPAAFHSSAAPSSVSVASTPEEFDVWLKKSKDGCGVAFHRIRTSEGVARVSSSVFKAGGESLKLSWITLHRRDGAQWMMLPSSAHQDRSRSFNDPNLQPAINRNYGAQDPLKVVRLDLLMECIRVHYGVQDYLRFENIDVPGEARELDRSYLPLLERYRASASPNVRYSAEFEVARITRVPDVRAMVEAIEEQPQGPIQTTARQVLSDYVLAQFKAYATPASSSERTELVRVAQGLKGPATPTHLPRERDITAVKRWQTFAMVDVRFGDSGYSLLFERRDDQWVFICVAQSWIS